MDFIREIKSTFYIVAGLYIVMGFIMLIAPIFVNHLICYLIGALCLILGGLAIYFYISSEVYGPMATGTLVIAITMIVLGIFVIADPKGFSSAIPFVMGIILVIDGLAKLQSTRSLKSYNYKNWWTILLISIVIILFGLFLIFNPFKSLMFFIRLLGAFLMIDGFLSIINANGYNKVEKQIN